MGESRFRPETPFTGLIVISFWKWMKIFVRKKARERDTAREHVLD